MNTTNTRRHRQPPSDDAHGVCKIVAWPDALDIGLAHGAAILSIRPKQGRWADYFVTRITDNAGRVLRYRLEKIVGTAEEAAPVYLISLVGGWDKATCSCPDAVHIRKGLTVCKHRMALAEALKRAGIDISNEGRESREPVACAVEFDDP